MMHEHQNHESLAKLAVGLLTVHIWLVIGYGWYLILQTGFFGVGWLSWLVSGLALIFLLSMGTLFAKQVIKELVRNALAQQKLSSMGCMSGIGLFIAMGALFAWALTRDLNLAWQAFLYAPLVALLAALVVTYVPQLVRRWRP